MAEVTLQEYLDLSPLQIRTHLMNILARDLPLPGKRQVSFNAVETLLCYGLFSLVDPHHYGGANIDLVPEIVGTLATFFIAEGRVSFAVLPHIHFQIEADCFVLHISSHGQYQTSANG